MGVRLVVGKGQAFPSTRAQLLNDDPSHLQLFAFRCRASPHPTSALAVSAIAAMFHDLNVPWTDATRELQRTVAFLDECELLVVVECANGGLTRCSRIRCRCSHTHLFGKTAL